MRAHFVVRITPADVGSRVTVRYRRDADNDGPRHSDVVGTLQAWQDGMLRIEDRHGTVKEVAEDRLVAGRVVDPPKPRPRRAR